MIYNTAGVDDIHAVRDDVRTPNAVSFFISIAPRGVLLFSIGIFGVFFCTSLYNNDIPLSLGMKHNALH